MKSNKPSINKIHELGITIYPENVDNEPNSETLECFYGSDLDDSDDDYVNTNLRFGDKKTDAVLCCAYCFTPVCYQCKTVGYGFRSKSAVNVYIDDSRDYSLNNSEEKGESHGCDANKRKFEGNQDSFEKTAKCIECHNIIATIDESNNYKFKEVIASKP